MAETITFTVPGPVRGKGRPRVTKAGHTYTPKETVQYENLVKLAFRETAPGWVPWDGPVEAWVTVRVTIPKSWPKWRRESAEKCMPGAIECCRRPDLDNVAKIVLDSLNGLAYRDDAQVCDLSILRVWRSCAPEVHVELIFVDAWTRADYEAWKGSR